MKRTVLLVDDEAHVLDAIVDVLSLQPFHVLRASSGKEALEILATKAVDVIVCDENMPGLKGSEVMSWVRRARPNIVRIILTGAATIDSAFSAIHDGCVYKYLHKPCKPDELIAAINFGVVRQSLRANDDEKVMMTPDEQEDLIKKVSAK